jgi:hypothetical protein
VAPCDFIRCTHNHPLISRSDSRTTPVTQAKTSIGSQGSMRIERGQPVPRAMPSNVRETGGTAISSTRIGGANAVAGVRIVAGENSTPAGTARHSCTAVTAGSVSINDNPIVETT